MIDINLLKVLGIKRTSLDTYAKFGSIEYIDDKIIVKDARLYNEFLLKAIDNKEAFYNIVSSIEDEKLYNLYMSYYYILFGTLDEALKYIVLVNDYCEDANILFDLLTKNNVDYSKYMKEYDSLQGVVRIICNHLNSRRYSLCPLLFDVIRTYDDRLIIYVLRNLCSKLEDNVSYIVSPLVYRDPVILFNYRNMERKLLFLIETGLVEDALEYNKALRSIYIEQNTLIFDIIHVFLIRLKNVYKDKRMIATRKDLGVFGDTYSVIFALLNACDFYRVREVIKNEYRDNEDRIEYLILDALSNYLKIYLDRNTELIKQEIELNTFGDNSIEEVVGKYELSTISLNTLKEFEELENNIKAEDGDLNYFEVYQMLNVSGDYKGALSAIRKFQYNMKRLNINVNFDYIEKDLEIRLINDTGVHSDKYNKCVDLGNKAYLNEEYDKALKYLEDALNNALKVNPVILAKIAKCYYYTGDISLALMNFRDAYQSFMYPEDILFYIDLLYEVQDYATLIHVIEKYEEYYVGENPKIHYIKSIAYLNFGKYDKALEEIEYTELIIQEMYTISYEFKYEKSIIEKLRNNKKIEVYSLSDYIDFNLSYEEKEIRERIDMLDGITSNSVDLILEDAKNINDSEEVIKYLSSLIKVLLSKSDIKSAKKVYDFTINYINSINVTSEKKNELTLSLKNYRNL